MGFDNQETLDTFASLSVWLWQWEARCCLSRRCQHRFCCWQLVWNQSSDTCRQLPATRASSDTFIPKVIHSETPQGAHILGSLSRSYGLLWMSGIPVLYTDSSAVCVCVCVWADVRWSIEASLDESLVVLTDGKKTFWIISSLLCLLYWPQAWLHTHTRTHGHKHTHTHTLNSLYWSSSDCWCGAFDLVSQSWADVTVQGLGFDPVKFKEHRVWVCHRVCLFLKIQRKKQKRQKWEKSVWLSYWASFEGCSGCSLLRQS